MELGLRQRRPCWGARWAVLAAVVVPGAAQAPMTMQQQASASNALPAAAGTLFDNVTKNGYPWSRRLMGLRPRDKAMLKSSLRGGCTGNRSINDAVPWYTYSMFAADIQDATAYYQFVDRGLSGVILGDLLRRRRWRNKHVAACLPALVRALQVWRIHLLNTAFVDGIDNKDLWANCFHDMGVAEDIVRVLTCSICEPEERAEFEALYAANPWRSGEWVEGQWKSVGDMWTNQLKDQEEFGLVIERTSKSTETGDDLHFKLFRDGVSLLEKLRKEGLVRSWVVARGTMIFAMRYGHTRGVRLPSGRQDMPTVPPLDMDVYALADNWAALRGKIGGYAKEFGFSWCGFQANWPEGTLSCLREDAELEVNKAEWSWASSMLPNTHCLVQAVANASTTPEMDFSRSDDYVELNCPRDPVAFMTHLWGKSNDLNLLDCLPLPMSLKTHEQTELSQEDVRWMWNRALNLHTAGYLSMAAFYDGCRNHPHAELANGLAREAQAACLGTFHACDVMGFGLPAPPPAPPAL